MGTNIKLTVIMALIYVTTVYSTCRKTIFGCGEESRSFQINAKIYPDKDSIQIGDTMWLEVDAPTTLKDGFSGTMIDYSGAANLGTLIGFGECSIIGISKNAANFFDYYLVAGRKIDNRNPEQIRAYLFDEKNNHYVFKLGVITKQKGIYGVAFGNAANVYRNSDKCTKAGFTINLENPNHHYYLNPNFQSGALPAGGENYYFKVY